MVRSLLKLCEERRPPKPMVVGLLAAGAAEREMRFDEARQLFEARGYPCARDLSEAIDALHTLRRAETGDPPRAGA